VVRAAPLNETIEGAQNRGYARIAGARLEVTTGPDAGRSTVSDSSQCRLSRSLALMIGDSK